MLKSTAKGRAFKFSEVGIMMLTVAAGRTVGGSGRGIEVHRGSESWYSGCKARPTGPAAGGPRARRGPRSRCCDFQEVAASASAAMSKRHGGCSDCPEQPATRSEGRRLLSLKLRALTDSCIPESVPGRGYLSVCHCDWGYPLPDFESGQLPITIELRNLGAT